MFWLSLYTSTQYRGEIVNFDSFSPILAEPCVQRVWAIVRLKELEEHYQMTVKLFQTDVAIKNIKWKPLILGIIIVGALFKVVN